MNALADYRALLDRKAIRATTAGIDAPKFTKSPMKDFQKIMVKWALERGRCALFASTGLGKTLMQLTWANAMRAHHNAPVLIFAPLAVAQQSVGEANKFGIKDVGYARDQSEIMPITVTNYDRLDKFDLSAFSAVVLDESSIIKSVDGKFRAELTDAAKSIAYRLCCSATPAPNDYVELGQHSEFLGILSAKEMLSTWFVHDGSGQATNVKNKGKPVAQWRLKGHAEEDFWRWVASWAMMVRKPSDLGCNDAGYDLPPLRKHQITVPVKYESTQFLFDMQASTLGERLQARKRSVADRCKAAADLVNASPDDQWLIWCHLNSESNALTEHLGSNTIEVVGADSPEYKVAAAEWFKGNVCICENPLFRYKLSGWKTNQNTKNDIIKTTAQSDWPSLLLMERQTRRSGKSICENTTHKTKMDGTKELASNAMLSTRTEEKNTLRTKHLDNHIGRQPLSGKKTTQRNGSHNDSNRLGLPLPNIATYSENNLEGAPFAEKQKAATKASDLERGLDDSTLTTATKPGMSGGFYAQAAISGSESLATMPKELSERQCTCGHSSGKRRLVSKVSIFGFGLNFQSCHKMVFVGLNDSFEQLFQALRRCWRFGQQHPVDAYLISSELEGAVVKNLDAKESAYVEMGDKLASHIMEYQNPRARNLGKKSTNMGRIPTWLM